MVCIHVYILKMHHKIHHMQADFISWLLILVLNVENKMHKCCTDAFAPGGGG